MSFLVSNGGYENLCSYLQYSIAAPQNYGYNISRGLQRNYQCYICYIGLYSQLVFSRCTSVPEKVIKTLAHAGLLISLTSIHSAVKSLLRDASHKIKTAVHTLTTAFEYDNFDINLKSWEPTVKHPSSFVSTTSAT